jgi:hypothetical protein
MRLILSWQLPGKLLCITLFFHQLPLIQHCSIFYKKNAFQSTKIFRRIQWQNMLRMHLLQSRIPRTPTYRGGGTSPLGISPPCACGARFMHPALNSRLATCRWFSPISSTNKTDCHDITEILWKVPLNTINPTQTHIKKHVICWKINEFLKIKVSQTWW